MSHLNMIRRKFIIFPKFQLLLLATYLGILFVVFGLLWLQMSQSFKEMDVLAGLSRVERYHFEHFVDYQRACLLESLAITLVSGIAASTFATILVSHKFAGPLVRLRRYFESLAAGTNGPAPKLSFRKGDFLSDLPPIVNQAIERIEQGSEQDPGRRAS